MRLAHHIRFYLRSMPTDEGGGENYEIRLKGHLDPTWSDWFDGMTIIHEANGETLLVGTLADQAALHGLLTRVGDLSIPLISVNLVQNTPSGNGEDADEQRG